MREMSLGKESLVEVLRRNTKLDKKTQCMLWVKNIGVGGVQYWAKVVWRQVHGNIPPGHSIRHMCGNRLCVNVEHLYIFKLKGNNQEQNPIAMIEKIKRKIRINKETGCWEWIGGKYPTGYGKISVGFNKHGRRNITYVHRVLWECINGKINGLHLLHKCDNPSCVNPDHLFLGTHADNMRDMVAKGRNVKTYGKGKPQRKLDKKCVKDIRKSKLLVKELAEKYNVCVDTISKVRRYISWKTEDTYS